MFRTIYISFAKIVILAFLVILFGWLWMVWTSRKVRAVAAKLPTTSLNKALPLVGHLHHHFNKEWTDITEQLFKCLEELLSRNIETSVFWAGPVPLIGVWGVEDVQKVMTSPACREKSVEYKFLKSALGYGLITAPDNIWRITRRHANPVFQTNNLEHLTHIFNEKCREMADTLSQHLDGKPFDVLHYSRKIGFSIAPYFVTGSNVHDDVNSKQMKQFFHIAESVFGHMVKRAMQPFLWIEPIFKYIYKEELVDSIDCWSIFGLNKKTNKYQEEIIRVNVSLKNGVDQNFPNKKEAQSDGILSLLEMYNIIKKKLPDFPDEITQDEILTIYSAGTITVGASVSSFLLALAQYQDIQEKVYQEITSVLADGEQVTYNNVGKLEYLNQVYLEVLRFFNIIPVIARRCSKDLKLSACTIPAGSTIVMVLAGIHMNPKYYPNPKKFDPDRFSPENSEKLVKNTFIPFSGGHRNCIGKVYAEIILKTVVVHILRHYKLSTDMEIEKIKRLWTISLTSAEGYNIKLQKRN